MKSTWKLFVPQALYDEVCEACEQPFADSYLFGAHFDADELTPRTLTGYFKLVDDSRFTGLMKDLKIRLIRPTAFPGKGDRATAEDAGYTRPKR